LKLAVNEEGMGLESGFSFVAFIWNTGE
jgi:hypothetical protein